MVRQLFHTTENIWIGREAAGSLLLISVFLIFSACETEPDLLAPYKERAVVYGLLNQKDSIQIIDIGKVFLGKANAYDMAMEPDSSNYRKEDIEVFLEELEKDGSMHKLINLHDTLLQVSTPGIFNKKDNLAYYTAEKLYNSYNYRLKIKNLKTGYECMAETPVISVPNPGPGDTAFISRFSFNSLLTLKLDETKYGKIVMSWTSAPNAREYQITLRFHYKEFNSGNDTVNKFIDWRQPRISSKTLKGGEEFLQEIKGEEFYRFLMAQKDGGIFSDFSMDRKFSFIEIFMTMGGDELSIYSKIARPSSTVIYQERPYYTNIKNGLGLLSCRYQTSPYVRFLDNLSLRELRYGQYTSELNFR